MLNLPAFDDYDMCVSRITEKFTKSGRFLENIAKNTLDSEISDLMARDIPYFWVNAGEKIIRHRTGAKQIIDIETTPKERSIVDIKSLRIYCSPEHINVLNTFFDRIMT